MPQHFNFLHEVLLCSEAPGALPLAHACDVQIE
jgi:hypothetical protein